MTDIVRDDRLDEFDDDVQRYLSSMKHDEALFTAEIHLGKAHTVMLHDTDIINQSTAAEILNALDTVKDEGFSSLPGGYEDIQPAIEDKVIELTDIETGGYLHTARSRNDEVATALKLVLRNQLIEINKELNSLRETLLETAESHHGSLMPGYTHLQRAQPTTLAHLLLGYQEAFKRDTERIQQCISRVNTNPLGSAAFAGTSFEIDREVTTELLGFREPTRNTMDSVAARDHAHEATGNALSAMITASRLAADLVNWSTTEFNYVELPDEYSSTSSIMPQKKNPDTMEVLRSRSATVQAAHTAITSITRALPMSYNRDLQEVTPHLWKATITTKNSLAILSGAIQGAEFNTNAMQKAIDKHSVGATEIANHLVREHGLSFREAHGVIANVAQNEEYTADAIKKAVKSQTGKKIEFSEETLDEITDPVAVVERHDSLGAPGETKTAINDAKKDLKDDKDTLESKWGHLIKAQRKLMQRVKELT